jgi:hypothetical protein
MIPALSSKAVSAVIVMKPAPLGLVASHYGNADYCRIFTGLGSAVRSPKPFAGVQVDYIRNGASVNTATCLMLHSRQDDMPSPHR